jgi:hypothetical protein
MNGGQEELSMLQREVQREASERAVDGCACVLAVVCCK